VASNLTIESPNFEKIDKEAGQFTADAVSVLWQSLNAIYAELRRRLRLAEDMQRPKVLTITPTASVDNLDLQGCSVVLFNGTSSVNFTGMKAPETGTSQVVYALSTGSGTITAKQNVTSESANRLANSTGADKTLTRSIYVYAGGLWREIA
jgi:hypothetical protein